MANSVKGFEFSHGARALKARDLRPATARMNDESLSPTTFPSPGHLGHEERYSRGLRIRVVIASILLVCVVLVVIDSFTTKRVESMALAFFEWVEANPFRGVLSIVLVYTIATSM